VFSDWPLALALCVFLTCWGGALVYAAAFKRADWADPVIQFLAFFALFTLPLPVRALITHEIEGDVTKHLPQLIAYLPASVLLAALAVICFVLAYYSDVGGRIASRLWVPSHPRRDPYGAAIVLGVFSLLLLARLTQNSGGIINFILLGYASSAQTFGQNGYLAIGFPWLYVALTFFLYRYAVRRRARDLVLYGIGFAAVAGMQMIMGNRSIVLYMVLVTIIFVHSALHRVTMPRLIPIVAAGFVALNMAGYLRKSHYESPAAAFRQWTQGFQEVSSSEELRNGWYYTLTTGEFVVPFETMPQMIRSIGTDVPPQWGASFATAPLFFVPSAVFPNRPLTIGQWYMAQFYGDERRGLNEGRGFYFLSEGYMNFGPVGIPLLALCWGVFWRMMREYLVRARRDPGAALLYAFTVAYMFRSIAGDSRTLLVGIAEQAVVPAILGLMMIGAWRFRRGFSTLRGV
jgi:hypothetical protein